MQLKSMMVRIGGDPSGLGAAFKQANGMIQRNADKFRKAGRVATVAGAAIVGTLGMMVKGYVTAGDEVHKMGLRTGFSTEALSELKYACEISGTSLDSLEKGVKKMASTIGEAKLGVKSYTDAFKLIGMDVQELEGLNPEQQFMKMAAGIAAIEDPTMRAHAAQKLLGRAGTELLPLFAEGAEGMEALRQKAVEMGLSISGPAAAGAAGLGDAMTTLKGTFQGVGMALAEKLAPMITDLVEKISAIIGKVQDWIKENPALSGVLIKVVAVVGVLATVLGPILIMLPALAAGFSILLGPVGLVIAAVAGLSAVAILVVKNWETITDFFSGLWDGIVTIFSDAWDAIKTAVETAIGVYIGIYETMFETIKTVVSGAWETISGFFTDAYDAVKTALTGFVTDFIGAFKTFVTDLLDAVGGLVTKVIEKFTGMFRKVKEVVGKLKDATVGIFKSLKEKIVGGSIVPDMCRAIMTAISDMKTNVVGQFEDLKDESTTAMGDWSTEMNGIAQTVTDHWGQLGDNISRSFGTAFEDILTAGTDFEDAMGLLLDGILGSFKTMLGNMVTEFLANNVFDKMKSSAADAASSITDTLKGGAGAAAGASPWGAIAGGAISGIASLVGASKTKGAIDATNRELHNIWAEARNCLNNLDNMKWILEDVKQTLWRMADNLIPILDDIKHTAWAIADAIGNITSAQTGFHGMVSKPTAIIVHPGEPIDIGPLGKMGGAAPVVHHHHQHYNFEVYALDSQSFEDALKRGPGSVIEKRIQKAIDLKNIRVPISGVGR